MDAVISPPFSPDAYQVILAGSGNDPEAVFVDLGIPLAQRLLRQNGAFPQHTDLIEPLLRAVWRSVHRGGLPLPLAHNELGEASEPDERKIGHLRDEVTGQIGSDVPDIIQIFLYQILVTLTQSEFKACRMSYLEEDADGCVERQTKDYCQDRISGIHCEDCPYFVALSQKKHERFLGKQWREDQAEFANEMSRFIPSDFRMLRIFWYLHVREYER